MAKSWMDRVLDLFGMQLARYVVAIPKQELDFSFFLPLEPRMMFDGVGLLTHPDDDTTHDNDVAHHTLDTNHPIQETNDFMNRLAQSVQTQEYRLPEPNQRREILFIDSTVPDCQTLLTGASPNRQVVVLDAKQDGVQQITNILTKIGSPFDAIHIISHGSDAQVSLGNTVLSSDTINTYQQALTGWGKALTQDGDLLFYGCDVGAGEKGAAFVNRVAQITGADVAASEDLTGAASKGGDWILEKTTGTIESAVAVDALAQKNYTDILSTYTVTSAADSGVGTLRQAISDANSNPGADTIIFDATQFAPAQPLVNRTITLSSELSVTDSENLIINGDTNGDSIADITLTGAGANVRGFNVTMGSATKTLDLQNLTIDNFDPTTGDGGAILMNTGTLYITNSTISNNSATSGVGGGIKVTGATLHITNSTIANNSADGAGAIMIDTASTVTLNNTTVSNNTATGQYGYGGGGISMDNNSILTINNSTFSGNRSANDGGAIMVASGTATINNSTITANISDNDNDSLGAGGGIYVWNAGGGSSTLNNTIVAQNIQRTDGSTTSNDVDGTFVGTSSYNLIGDDSGL
ncbi:MAG: DUF4347 domain-containing protein, partial [Magnetococcus sp. YQC-5]